MTERFLKKIISQNEEDLRVISALCSESKIKQTDIKYLKDNKIFWYRWKGKIKRKIKKMKG